MVKIQAPPEWGIEPIPKEHRHLGFLDFFVLWGDLGIGLLVLLAGSLLIPSLSLGQAFLAILLGSVIGCALLALAGVVGSETGVPTMVLFRPVLGIRGSYVPTLLNLIQLIGWGAFEVIIMAQAANGISKALFGFESYLVWVLLFGAFCTLLAVGGPVVVIRQWLEKFAVWLVLLTTLWIAGYLLMKYDIGSLLRRAGTGEMSFWRGVDLVIAMPVSWLPLVADYSRFARASGRGFGGTYLGYFLANVIFYGLGAVLVLALQTQDLIAALMATAGWLGLLIILVDETDEAFADIYSAAVSLQNLFPKARQRHLAVGIGVACILLALLVPIVQYENFLLLIGSVFVPLFGVLAADYFVVRSRRYEIQELYRPGGRYWYTQGIWWRGMASWLFGVLVYHLIERELPSVGASLPSLVAAFLLHLLLSEAARRVGKVASREV